MSEERKTPRWMRLDNAGLIFPASLRKTWSNAFRISVTMEDPIDPAVLQNALDRTAVRFPGICARLRRSFFWFYLEETDPPTVHEDSYQPLVGMRWKDIRRCAIRVLYYRDRMAVEFFHSVTDGTGGMIFTKNLAAEYIRMKYGETVPLENDLKDLDEPVPEAELIDSFQEHAGPVAAPRDDYHVFHLTGETEKDRFLHPTCGILDAAAEIVAIGRANAYSRQLCAIYLIKQLADSSRNLICIILKIRVVTCTDIASRNNLSVLVNESES